MPQRIYNTFYTWIKQDDILWSAGFIEWKNIDGTNTGKWITLWPKSNKLFTTNGAMRGIYIDKRSFTTRNDLNFAFWDNWEIYRFDWLDNTPIYTTTLWYMVSWIFVVSTKVFFVFKNSTWSTTDLWKSDTLDFSSWVDESYWTSFLSNNEVIPIEKLWSKIYFWWSNQMVSLDNTSDPIASKLSFGLFDWTCQWIASFGNQLYLYISKWECITWDWASAIASGRNQLFFPPRRILQTTEQTFVASRDGWIYRWNGWQFITLKKREQSNRLEDNSGFQEKFNFSWTDVERGQYMANAWDKVFIWCNDGTPGIYIYDNIVSWTQRWFHKAITNIHDWTAIDEIYAIDYDHTQDRVFYSYKAGTTYGIDYIDITNKESATSWYGVTEVFTGGTSFKKKLNVVRISVNNVDANNTASLYYRVNNGSWVLLRTINTTTEWTYYRENISKQADGSAFSQFIDIQFKIELTSNNNDTTPPILNEMIIDYTIIEA